LLRRDVRQKTALFYGNQAVLSGKPLMGIKFCLTSRQVYCVGPCRHCVNRPRCSNVVGRLWRVASAGDCAAVLIGVDLHAGQYRT
jgi:hypothetical protein